MKGEWISLVIRFIPWPQTPGSLCFPSPLVGEFQPRMQFSSVLVIAGNALFLRLCECVNNKRRKRFHLLAESYWHIQMRAVGSHQLQDATLTITTIKNESIASNNRSLLARENWNNLPVHGWVPC